eukprot:TRINITY_DN14208_c0_g1_i1.p1 TRINITY_DN14208_c0_g1~~TRINITY_DN14208_c0_g1_i1.p1  ORF type:complete len:137 (-),score=22.05 TRINITY_DN14208_c0_g1_i1:575-985(-)
MDRVDIPKPLPENTVLVKIDASSINPIDILNMAGAYGYGKGPGPHILGAGGAGVVIAVVAGKGAGLLGRRVAINSGRRSLWAKYAVVNATDCVTIDDRSYKSEEVALGGAYPLTAMMFLNLAHQQNSKAVSCKQHC